MAKDTTADATYTPQFFMPDVYSVQNYYAFGQSMPNWSSTAAVNDPKKYRFGFNGKEDDDEWAKQDYGFRIYDGRIGRFLSVDPLMKGYPMLTPYQSSSNSPISGIDLDGLEYYYAADGSFIGKSGTSTKVMLITSENVIPTAKTNLSNSKWDHSWLKDHSKLIHKDHTEFEQVAAMGYNENVIDARAQQATENIVLNRAVNSSISEALGGMAGSGIGLTHESRLNNKKTFGYYADFSNITPAKRNDEVGMKSSVSSAIKAFSGDDITGGGLYEKGTDWFDKDLRTKGKYAGTHWPDYLTAQDQGYTWKVGGTFEGDYKPETHPEHRGNESGGFMYLITAGYDGNTFMKINPDFEKEKAEFKKNQEKK
jgi:RHS repeat-associated protein